MPRIERQHLPVSFASRLQSVFDTHGQLCVGIDPHPELLEDWGLSDTPSGLESFGKAAIAATAGTVGIIKPQVSFFERHGSRGFAVLESLCELAAEAKLLVIMDAKRGDIGTTMQAYYDAWLGQHAPFLCDALTVNPYLGFESLKGILSQSAERGKGVFVLSATSNPEGAQLQQSVSANGLTVAANIWSGLAEVNSITAGPGERLGNFGAVIGATVNPNRYGLGGLSSNEQGVLTPILAPGFGAQGARLQDTARLFGSASRSVIANVSRSVLKAGGLGLSDAVITAKNELLEGLA